jgi:flagellar biosynthesis/type III secretory pathway protein FliH
MSDKTAKPVQFPVHQEPAPKRPAWLEDGQGASVRKLFQPANDESRPALGSNERSVRPSEMPPANTNASVPPPAPQAPPQPQQRAQPQPQQAAPQPQPAAAADQAQRAAAHRAVEAAAARSEHADHGDAEHAPEERSYSKLPPPPLIPGARSSPPTAAANEAGLELLHEQREAFTNAALELAMARTATLAVLESQLLDLSIEIAESLIEHEIARNPELHSTLAHAALKSLGDTDRVTLRTSPDAFEAICQQLGGPETTVNGVHVTVHADDTIPGLGCIVDGESVRIDATVTERLRAVRRAFADERRKVAESTE